MRDGREITSLIGDLYEMALSGGSTVSVPLTLQRLGHASSVSLWTFNAASGAVIGEMRTTLPAQAIDQYTRHYHAHDPWSAPLARKGLSDVVFGGDLVPGRTLERSCFYAEFGRRFDVFHTVGAVVPLGHGRHGAFVLVRPRSMEAFGNAERSLLRHIKPHVQRALQLHESLRADTDSSMAARAGLDALTTASVITDGHGSVLFANQAAERLARANLGFCLGTHAAPISATAPKQTTRLLALIADAARGGAGGSIILLGPDGASVVALVSPALLRGSAPPAVAARAAGALIVFRVDTRPEVPGVGRLCREVFGMTRSEADVAAMLTAGMAPARIALVRSVALSTVRTLIRRALGKSGAGSVRELVTRLAVLQER